MVIWKTWTFNIKFSSIAFFVTAIMGLLSMGALDGILYYPVSILFASYPTIDDWHGDWVWPTLIMAGMLWSFGFVIAAVAWYYLCKITQSNVLLTAVYAAILWLWAALLWAGMIMVNLDQLT